MTSMPPIGKKVRIKGLTEDAEYNGTVGEVEYHFGAGESIFTEKPGVGVRVWPDQLDQGDGVLELEPLYLEEL
jgi:hypothetical protein